MERDKWIVSWQGQLTLVLMYKSKKINEIINE